MIFKKLTIGKPLTVLLPGGNSPKIFFNRLINCDINWSQISLMATDDRVVSLSSTNSNTGLIKRELVDNITNKNKPGLIGLYPKNKEDIENNLELLEYYLSKNTPEIAFLGIGEDGHTAGIFEKRMTKNSCYSLKNLTDPYYRITISMNLLIRIPYLIFFVLGSNKKKSMEKILFNKNNKRFLPARFLLKNGLGKKIILCDRKAAPSKIALGESMIDFN